MLLYLSGLFALSIFGFLYSIKLPIIYESVKSHVLIKNKELAEEEEKEKISPIIAIVFSLSALGIYYFTVDIKLSLFVFIFSCVAYSDYTVRWTPDLLIYGMVWISILGFNQSPIDGLISIVLFCFPAIVLNILSYVKTGQGCIASGDWYVFPAVGVWISPENALLHMVLSIGIALIASRYIKSVPLITCLFPVFIGGQLCQFLSIL